MDDQSILAQGRKSYSLPAVVDTSYQEAKYLIHILSFGYVRSTAS